MWQASSKVMPGLVICPSDGIILLLPSSVPQKVSHLGRRVTSENSMFQHCTAVETGKTLSTIYTNKFCMLASSPTSFKNILFSKKSTPAGAPVQGCFVSIPMANFCHLRAGPIVFLYSLVKMPFANRVILCRNALTRDTMLELHVIGNSKIDWEAHMDVLPTCPFPTTITCENEESCC